MQTVSTSSLFAYSEESDFLKQFSPVDRGLPDLAERVFFGDSPERPHQVLWDRASALAVVKSSIIDRTKIFPVVIVGGGMSGLISAWLLRQYQPIILEQASRFGGNSKGQSWRGADYSIGAAYIVEPEPDSSIYKLLDETGALKILSKTTQEAPIAVGNKLYGNFWEFENHSTPLLLQLKKLKRYLADVYNEENGQFFPDIPITNQATRSGIDKLDQLDFRNHLKQILGSSLHPYLDRLIEHYCWSSFGGSASEISAASGLNFYSCEFSPLYVAPGGNSGIAECILSRLSQVLPQSNLKCSSLVFDIATEDDLVKVSYRAVDGSCHSIYVKTVIAACPKFVASKIIRNLEEDRLRAINKLRYRSYIVANVLLEGNPEQLFYDLYLLGKDQYSESVLDNSKKRNATDVILANFASAGVNGTVLTLYRAFPYDGARPELLLPNSYKHIRDCFEKQITNEILPLLKLDRNKIVDLRLARWGHPLPLAAKGLIADGTVDLLRRPFRERVFFIEQDNWALPAFETAASEALLLTPKVAKLL